MSMLSLNKKHQFNKLILDNCNLSDESLIQLCRLIIKFEKVTLNGSQKISREGWKHLAEAIKTIIVAAGGVDINSPHYGLRSVEIVDVSSPDPRWKYGNTL